MRSTTCGGVDTPRPLTGLWVYVWQPTDPDSLQHLTVQWRQFSHWLEHENTYLCLCSQPPHPPTIFVIKLTGSSHLYSALPLFLELVQRAPVCAAQTGSRASRQLIQSYPNSANLWVANTPALPHKDRCVGLIKTKHWAEHKEHRERFPAGQMVPDFVIKDAQIRIPRDRTAWWNYKSVFKIFFHIECICSRKKKKKSSVECIRADMWRCCVLWKNIKSARKQHWLSLQLTLSHY